MKILETKLSTTLLNKWDKKGWSVVFGYEKVIVFIKGDFVCEFDLQEKGVAIFSQKLDGVVYFGKETLDLVNLTIKELGWN